MYKRPGRRVWYASLSDTEKHISLRTEDEERAREAFAKLVADRGSLPLEADEKSIADLWKITRERADTNNTPKTAYELHLNLRRVCSWLEARGIVGSRKIDKQVIEDYKTARRFDDVSAARINRELDSWRRMMKEGVDLNAVHPNVIDCFVKLREPRAEPHRRTLTKVQIERLIQHMRPPAIKALVRAAIGCGLRDDELRHVEAIDVRKAEVAVTPKPGWTTKGYHFRVIPISAATRKALLTWIEARDSRSVNTDKKAIWLALQRGCKAAGVPPTSLHELRRAWASHLYERGVALKSVSQLLGHKEVATTERYLRIVTPHLPAGVKLPW
jgi:site-specific recombinase XerD